jgi:hypothetical protein
LFGLVKVGIAASATALNPSPIIRARLGTTPAFIAAMGCV